MDTILKSAAGLSVGFGLTFLLIYESSSQTIASLVAAVY